MAEATETEKKVTYTLEEIAENRPMALAPEIFEEYAKAMQSGNKRNYEEAKSGLEETLIAFYEKAGIKKRRIIEDTIAPLFKPQGLQALKELIDNFNGRYHGALVSQKLKDLRKLYDPSFKKYYSEENLAEVDKLFNSDETYESFMKKYAKAAEKAKNEAGNFTEDEQKKAQAEVEKLDRILMPLQIFENAELDKLRVPINEKTYRRRLNTPYNQARAEAKKKAA